MKTGYVFLCVGIIVFLVVAGLLSYVGNLDDEIPPISETEKKGRAKYLIDTRWPFIDLKQLFFDEEVTP